VKFILRVCFVAIGLIAIAFTFACSPPNNPKARIAVGEKHIFPVRTAKLDKDIAYYANGKGPRILMAASAGREVSDFNELAMSLNKGGYRTLLVENVGIGGTSMPEEHYLSKHSTPLTYALMADNDKKIEQPYFFIGHAYGNRLARKEAFTHSILWNDETLMPNAVILLSASGQVPPDPEADAALKRVYNPPKSHNSRMADVRTAFFAEGNDIPNHWTRGWHTKTAIAQGKAKGDEDDSWHCAGGVPILIIQPMQDKIAPPENAYALRDKCPQEVEIVEVQNAGHALLPEQPEAVAEAVLAFLAKHHPIETLETE